VKGEYALSTRVVHSLQRSSETRVGCAAEIAKTLGGVDVALVSKVCGASGCYLHGSAAEPFSVTTPTVDRFLPAAQRGD